ncbi:MAG TPA: iron-sulfur cluster assembly scaffold protein [Rhizomicrobium sp.]|nr:iron-sulfur cluster assembly scaffold protein [Rhizomicrobium sp.]
MSDPLYKKELLRLAADAHGAGRLPGANASGHAHNPVCGDRVVVDLVLENGRVADVRQEAKACVLTQASASILGKSLKGMSRADIEALQGAVGAMLQAGGPTPGEPFADYAAFDAALAYPGRHICVLLPIQAALAAFEASEAQEPEPVRR